jgi:CDGSH-type Zn-finger protein
MSKHTTEDRFGHLRTTIEIQSNERVSICRCWGSKEWPFCDGTHKKLPINIGPAVVTVTQEEQGGEKA